MNLRLQVEIKLPQGRDLWFQIFIHVFSRDSTRRRSSEENAKRRTTRRRESIIHKSGKVGYVDVVVGEKDDINVSSTI